MLSLVLIYGPAWSTNSEKGEVPQVLYVVPFLNVMIPENVSTNLFDRFIDEMMTAGEAHSIKVRILKQDIDAVDREWLGQQYFVTGELFDYDRESGCCSTELEARARIYYYRPGSVDPFTEITVSGDAFFDHDLSSLSEEQARMGSDMAGKLSSSLIFKIVPVR